MHPSGGALAPPYGGLLSAARRAARRPPPPPQGFTQIRPQQCGANVRGALQRLWLHEHLRVYADRLVDAADGAWLRRALLEVAAAKFDWRCSYEELFDPDKEVVFGERSWVGGRLLGAAGTCLSGSAFGPCHGAHHP
jgi:hypothetical protein